MKAILIGLRYLRVRKYLARFWVYYSKINYVRSTYNKREFIAHEIKLKNNQKHANIL